MHARREGRRHGRSLAALSFDDLRADCPDGPSDPIEWEGGASPSLWDLVATIDQKKFLGTKQFTVHASKTWKGQVKPFSRSSSQGHYLISGDKTVTWSWEATFRKKGKKKQARR